MKAKTLYEIPLVKGQCAGTLTMLFFHAQVNLNDKPEKELLSSDILPKVKSISDMLQKITDQGSIKLSYNELCFFYSAAHMFLRLMHTKFAKQFLSSIQQAAGKKATKTNEEYFEYLEFICSNHIKFLNNCYGDEPGFIQLRNYVEEQMK